MRITDLSPITLWERSRCVRNWLSNILAAIMRSRRSSIKLLVRERCRVERFQSQAVTQSEISPSPFPSSKSAPLLNGQPLKLAAVLDAVCHHVGIALRHAKQLPLEFHAALFDLKPRIANRRAMVKELVWVLAANDGHPAVPT